MSQHVKHAAVAVARAERVRQTAASPDSEREVVEARRHLAETKLADYIERTLATAPPLTDEQRRRLARLLTPYVGAA